MMELFLSVLEIFIFIVVGMVMLLVIVILTMPIRHILPKAYTCNLMEWHGHVEVTGSDGCSLIGKCTKCNKDLLRDGQGNWF